MLQSLLLCDTVFFISQDMVSFSEVAPAFDQGAHHPTILVVLQAMVALIGEVSTAEHTPEKQPCHKLDCL